MNVTKNDGDKYLSEVRDMVNAYIFGKDMNLTTRFGGSEELVPLYIKFNKIQNHYLIVISFHKQDYPLTYKFK